METRAQKKALRDREKRVQAILDGLKFVAHVEQTTCELGSLPFTKTGWSGKDYHRRQDIQWLGDAWERREITRIMIDNGFRLVPFEGCCVVILCVTLSTNLTTENVSSSSTRMARHTLFGPTSSNVSSWEKSARFLVMST